MILVIEYIFVYIFDQIFFKNDSKKRDVCLFWEGRSSKEKKKHKQIALRTAPALQYYAKSKQKRHNDSTDSWVASCMHCSLLSSHSYTLLKGARTIQGRPW
jgi:hypothetical protein